MSGNTLGKLFTLTTAGESHGPGYVAIVDGCPPGVPLSEADLQVDLDRRKPRLRPPDPLSKLRPPRILDDSLRAEPDEGGCSVPGVQSVEPGEGQIVITH